MQQAEAPPPQGAEDPLTTPHLCAIFVAHQIQAYSANTDPTIRTETAARAAYAAFVHELLHLLRSAHIRQQPPQQP